MISDDVNDTKVDIENLKNFENYDDAMYSSMQNSRYKIAANAPVTKFDCRVFEENNNIEKIENEKFEKIDDFLKDGSPRKEAMKRILIVDDSMLCQKIITKVCIYEY
jgi:hypothetical protein